MNPALLLLLPLAALGLLWRRRASGIAWLAAGLAATSLLAGALALPQGVPSQAGVLAAHAPWRGLVAPAPANPHLLDVTHQVEPWLLFLRHELRAGRLPFWDPHQSGGEPFWSNGSSAPLFPLHLLFALLPVELGLLLLPWLRVAIGGCGAAALARQLGVAPRPALVAAVAYPLSGMVVSFLLFPMGNTHALVPWVFWAVERIAAGRGSWPALALAGGLQLLGGHPETPVFTALLAVVYLAVRGPWPAWRTWWRFLVGWAVAGALSAVQTLPLAYTALASSKWLHWQAPTPIPWRVRGELLLRAVLPHPFGSAVDGTWWGPYNDPATALYAGAAVLPLAFAALPLLRSDRRWRAVVGVGAAALLGAYHFPLAKQLLLALPLVSHGLHHYLKIGLELGLALLAAAGWQRWASGARRTVALGAAGHLALLLVAMTVLAPHWRAHGQLAAQLPWVVFGVSVSLGLLALARMPETRRSGWSWLVPALLLGDLATAHGRINPAVAADAIYPPTPAVEFLRGKPGRMAATGSTFRPDAAMVYGLDDVRGDSPVKLEHYQRLYASIATADPVYFRPITRWDHPHLDVLGVRWVMTPPGEGPAAAGWQLAFDGSDARVWERASAAPLARWETADGPAPRLLDRSPGRWRIRWRSTRPRRLLIAETWDPGWRATASGRPLVLRRWHTSLMAIDLPAGEGALDLRYRPAGLLTGLACSLLASGALLTAAMRQHRLGGGRPAPADAQWI